MKKLGEDSSNVVTLETLNQLLKDNDIRTKSQKKKGELMKVTEEYKPNENYLQTLKITIKKLIDKMKQSGIEVVQLY